jgi:hypothetical protein
MTNSVRQNVIELILEITKQGNAFDLLEQALAKMDKETLGASLLKCGIIPERFDHDSSEEKLWAKYCDILLAKSWTGLNIPAEVLRARGDSAWDTIDDTVCQIIEMDIEALSKFKLQAIEETRKIGEGINYWQSRIEAYQQLSQEEAVARLVKAEKIEAKINTIKRAMQISLEA